MGVLHDLINGVWDDWFRRYKSGALFFCEEGQQHFPLSSTFALTIATVMLSISSDTFSD
jgi:hypothetical protein